MSHAPTASLSARHDSVRRELTARSLDALVVTHLPNALYLTNFTGSAAIAVVTADRLYFITDFRYLTAIDQARGTPHECPGLELVKMEGSYDQALAGVLASLPIARVGFEAKHLDVSRHQWLTARLPRGATSGPELIPTEDIVERARLRKDAYEIATLREAARRVSAVARQVPSEVRAGLTEAEVALAIDVLIRRAGFAKTSFDTIVASGPNSALPHARPGERRLVEGDLVVLDFGGIYDSYCVDLTRTVSIGKASSRARDVYAAVREAHDRAIASVGPGATRFAVDAAARDTLSGYGLGDAFGHGTGHGLGIEIHERPHVTRKRPGDEGAEDAQLAAGMVFTIEPGAYLPGFGGVRIEDDVLVTESGGVVLTDVPTELIEI